MTLKNIKLSGSPFDVIRMARIVLLSVFLLSVMNVSIAVANEPEERAAACHNFNPPSNIEAQVPETPEEFQPCTQTEANSKCCTEISAGSGNYYMKVCNIPEERDPKNPSYTWVCNFKAIEWTNDSDPDHIRAEPGHCAYVNKAALGIPGYEFSTCSNLDYPGVTPEVGRIVLR